MQQIATATIALLLIKDRFLLSLNYERNFIFDFYIFLLLLSFDLFKSLFLFVEVVAVELLNPKQLQEDLRRSRRKKSENVHLDFS